MLRMLCWIVAALGPVLAAEPAALRCSACVRIYSRLERALNATKVELEAAQAYNAKKAAKVDKVQKAQTKRWLKNEYNVELRAGVEEELERVCSRDELSSTVGLKTACGEVVEEHEDGLPRAVLDGKGADWCFSSLPGCTDDVAAQAGGEGRKLKSEKVPKPKATIVRGGAVRRLVGSTFGDFVREPGSMLVMLHHSAAPASTGFEPNDPRYATATSIFYELASGVRDKGGATLQFGQMDTRKNDAAVLSTTKLSDPKGLQLLLYVAGDKEEPKLLPQIGESPLAFADAAALVRKPPVSTCPSPAAPPLGSLPSPLERLTSSLLPAACYPATHQLPPAPPPPQRTRLTQLLLTYLKDKDAAAVRSVAHARSTAGSDANPAADGGAAPTPAPAPTPKPAEARAPRKKKKSAEESSTARARACDVCILSVMGLEMALNETKDELELSRDAAAKKSASIDKVQKAQTKRWLKQEYSVALAAAVEERLEKLCENDELTRPVCAPVGSATSVGFAARAPWQPVGGGAFSAGPCRDSGKEHCRALQEEHADHLLRIALDGKGPAACAKLLPACEAERVSDLAEAAAALSTPPPPPASDARLPDSFEAPLPATSKPTPKDEV